MRIIAPESCQMPVPGEHIVKLKSFEDLGMQADRFNEGEEVHRMKLVFELPDGSQQFMWCRVSLHPSSKFYEVATALLGHIPPTEIEVGDLVGRQCLIEVESYKGQDGKDRTKVADIRRAPSATTRTAQTARKVPNAKAR